MSPEFLYFIETVLNGLMAGVMYSLVALGFVLIFKASGVFNFSQGAMVLFAGMFLAGFIQMGVPTVVAFLLAIAVMIGVAFTVERLVLRPLVNQPGIILFMATIGITFFLTGLGEAIWGGNVIPLDVGIPTAPLFFFGGNVLVQSFDLAAGVVAGSLLVILLLMQKSAIGRALRAVADDHQAAMSVGIPLNHIWIIVWSFAGIVAIVAAVMWGAKLGIQPAIVDLALKALPVLILGGFTSIPGAIVGGLMIGAGEKLAEIYLGPLIGGGIENWFAYMLAMLILLIRPQGLFGEKIIERV